MSDEEHAPAIDRFKEAIEWAAVEASVNYGLASRMDACRGAAEELLRILDTRVCLMCASTAGGGESRSGGTWCRSCGENYDEVPFFVYAAEGGTESLPVTTPPKAPT